MLFLIFKKNKKAIISKILLLTESKPKELTKKSICENALHKRCLVFMNCIIISWLQKHKKKLEINFRLKPTTDNPNPLYKMNLMRKVHK